MWKIFPSFRIITAFSTKVSEIKVVRRISANDEFDCLGRKNKNEDSDSIKSNTAIGEYKANFMVSLESFLISRLLNFLVLTINPDQENNRRDVSGAAIKIIALKFLNSVFERKIADITVNV